MTENEISNQIIGRAIEVHRELGPGLLESSYQECLHFELERSGFLVEKQKPLPLIYQGIKLDCGYRVDLMVERKVLIEIKSIEALNDIHLAQVLTYLRHSGCKLGLLMNFNVVFMKDGVKRVANRL